MKKILMCAVVAVIGKEMSAMQQCAATLPVPINLAGKQGLKRDVTSGNLKKLIATESIGSMSAIFEMDEMSTAVVKVPKLQIISNLPVVSPKKKSDDTFICLFESLTKDEGKKDADMSRGSGSVSPANVTVLPPSSGMAGLVFNKLADDVVVANAAHSPKVSGLFVALRLYKMQKSQTN